MSAWFKSEASAGIAEQIGGEARAGVVVLYAVVTATEALAVHAATTTTMLSSDRIAASAC